MRAWLGLGGNEAESDLRIRESLERLDAAPGIELRRQSRLYRSPPWGLEDQADFINAVAEFETGLTPFELLEVLLKLEASLGRSREGPRWGPRCIDLDMLTYEKEEMASSRLELPHPRMHLRAFVLVPLLELEPEFRIPGKGTARAALQALGAEAAAAVVPVNASEQETSS
jgi:2-amino-4-hydroxy-6-hydroxymethyldihydropteridine diphosphokinase